MVAWEILYTKMQMLNTNVHPMLQISMDKLQPENLIATILLPALSCRLSWDLINSIAGPIFSIPCLICNRYLDLRGLAGSSESPRDLRTIVLEEFGQCRQTANEDTNRNLHIA